MSFFYRLFGAIKSRNKAAYFGIFYKAIRPITVLLDKILFALSKPKEHSIIPPCLIIVSPPRSGSTVTYQVLTRSIPSVCITNATYLFPFFGTKLLELLNKSTQNLKGFKNYYGYTSKIEDVNEGNEIIEMLIEGKNSQEIRRKFIKWLNFQGANVNKPMIIKNVRIYDQLEILLRAVPEITVLQIKRDLSQNIQSEIKAYHQLKSFHPIPLELKNKSLSPIEFAFHQINIINNTLNGYKLRFKDIKWFDWTYESLCETPKKHIEDLAQKGLGLENHKVLNVPNLKASFSKKISEKEMEILKKLIEKQHD